MSGDFDKTELVVTKGCGRYIWTAELVTESNWYAQMILKDTDYTTL